MKDLIKIEMYKIFKRKDFLLMISMIFIPLMYSIGLMMNSKSFTYQGDGKVSALLFVSEMFTFVYMCFVYFIVFSVSSVRSLKGEIENKSIQLYVQRINNRKKIYLAKNIAHFIVIIACTMVFIFVSIACFYLFLTKRSDIAVHAFFRTGEFVKSIIDILSILVCFIFVLNISMFLSAYKKSYEAMGIFIFLWLAFMYLKQLSYIKYFIPIYYVEKIVNSKRSMYSIKNFISLLMIVVIVSVICTILGCKKFDKSDI